MKKEYYIFGEDICRAYSEGTLVPEDFNNEVFGLAEFIVGRTSFFEVLSAFDGYRDFAHIPEELYLKLKELQKQQ